MGAEYKAIRYTVTVLGSFSMSALCGDVYSLLAPCMLQLCHFSLWRIGTGALQYVLK